MLQLLNCLAISLKVDQTIFYRLIYEFIVIKYNLTLIKKKLLKYMLTSKIINHIIKNCFNVKNFNEP